MSQSARQAGARVCAAPKEEVLHHMRQHLLTLVLSCSEVKPCWTDEVQEMSERRAGNPAHLGRRLQLPPYLRQQLVALALVAAHAAQAEQRGGSCLVGGGGCWDGPKWAAKKRGNVPCSARQTFGCLMRASDVANLGARISCPTPSHPIVQLDEQCLQEANRSRGLLQKQCCPCPARLTTFPPLAPVADIPSAPHHAVTRLRQLDFPPLLVGTT